MANRGFSVSLSSSISRSLPIEFEGPRGANASGLRVCVGLARAGGCPRGAHSGFRPAYLSAQRSEASAERWKYLILLVGVAGFEPATPASRTRGYARRCL